MSRFVVVVVAGVACATPATALCDDVRSLAQFVAAMGLGFMGCCWS